MSELEPPDTDTVKDKPDRRGTLSKLASQVKAKMVKLKERRTPRAAESPSEGATAPEFDTSPAHPAASADAPAVTTHTEAAPELETGTAPESAADAKSMSAPPQRPSRPSAPSKPPPPLLLKPREEEFLPEETTEENYVAPVVQPAESDGILATPQGDTNDDTDDQVTPVAPPRAGPPKDQTPSDAGDDGPPPPVPQRRVADCGVPTDLPDEDTEADYAVPEPGNGAYDSSDGEGAEDPPAPQVPIRSAKPTTGPPASSAFDDLPDEISDDDYEVPDTDAARRAIARPPRAAPKLTLRVLKKRDGASDSDDEDDYES